MTDTERIQRTTVRLSGQTHYRLTAHTAEGENLSGTVNRALLALGQERRFPTAVRDGLQARHDRAMPAEGGYTNVHLVERTHGLLHAENEDGETLSETLARALDALDRREYVPAVVSEVCAEG